MVQFLKQEHLYIQGLSKGDQWGSDDDLQGRITAKTGSQPISGSRGLSGQAKHVWWRSLSRTLHRWGPKEECPGDQECRMQVGEPGEWMAGWASQTATAFYFKILELGLPWRSSV